MDNKKNTVLHSSWKSWKSVFSSLVLHNLYVCQAKLHWNITTFRVNNSRPFVGFSIALERTKRGEGRVICLKVNQGKSKYKLLGHGYTRTEQEKKRFSQTEEKLGWEEGEGWKKMLYSVQLSHRKLMSQSDLLWVPVIRGKEHSYYVFQMHLIKYTLADGALLSRSRHRAQRETGLRHSHQVAVLNNFSTRARCQFLPQGAAPR